MQLRTKIILLVVPLLLLPVIVLTSLASRYLHDNLQREHEERISALSTQAQNAAAMRERQAATTLALYAENPIVRAFMLDEGATRYAIYEKPLLRFAKSVLRAYTGVRDMQVLMPDGIVDFSAVNAFIVGTRVPYFEQLSSSPGYLNQIMFSRGDETWQLLALPMYLKNDATDPVGSPATFRGYLVLELDIVEMYGLALRTAVDGSQMLLVNGDTGALIAPRERPDGMPESLLLEPLLQGAMRNLHAPPRTLPDGRLAIARKLSGSVYLVGLHSDEELRSALLELRSLSLVSSALIVLLTLGALVVGLNLIVLRRLGYLAQQIRLAKEGREVGAPEVVAGNDELSELTRLFLRTQRKLSEVTKSMAEMAFSDELTGLPNKVALQQSVDKAMALAKRHNELLAVLFLDLDNFKNVNDALGHEAGDQLLRTVAERLQNCVRGYDFVATIGPNHNPLRREEDSESTLARLGGDEFSILLNELNGPESCSQVAERIIASLGQPILVGDGHEVFVGTSIGISVFPQDGANASSLLKHADIAMYRAKAAGKNTYRFFDSSMNEVASERLEMEAQMRNALEDGEFELHYQPKVHLRRNWRYKEFEALLRWRHPERGLISPHKFIPIAEANGFVRNIGEWVVNEAARQIRVWNDSGFPHCRVSVNLSPVQVSYGSPLEGLLKAMGKYGVSAEQIEVEITESGLIKNEDQAISLLNSFRELGVRVALDDFGTGYSSLSYLRKLPIDTLKVDRSFVRDLVNDPLSETVLAAIVELAGKLKLLVVAEGVETEAQLDIVRAMGVDLVQGYYYSPALPAGEARAFVESALDARETVIQSNKAVP